jgi:hypothetical protein
MSVNIRLRNEIFTQDVRRIFKALYNGRIFVSLYYINLIKLFFHISIILQKMQQRHAILL